VNIFSILHFDVGENKLEYKEAFANAITRSYQFSSSNQVSVSLQAQSRFYFEIVLSIVCQQTREK